MRRQNRDEIDDRHANLRSLYHPTGVPTPSPTMGREAHGREPGKIVLIFYGDCRPPPHPCVRDWSRGTAGEQSNGAGFELERAAHSPHIACLRLFQRRDRQDSTPSFGRSLEASLTSVLSAAIHHQKCTRVQRFSQAHRNGLSGARYPGGARETARTYRSPGAAMRDGIAVVSTQYNTSEARVTAVRPVGRRLTSVQSTNIPKPP